MPSGKDDGLAIEINYKNGEQRLLLSRWLIRNVGEHGDRSMFVVKATCGCWSDISTYHNCGSHAGASTFRVIDVRAPVGPVHTVR